MSCRSTSGGRAASACAIAISGAHSNDVAEHLHRLRREYSGEPGQATVEETEQVLNELRFRANSPERTISASRQERIEERINVALDDVRNGINIPDKATLYAWRNLPAELEMRRLLEAQAPEAVQDQWEARVQALEAEGITRSDAQAIVDGQDLIALRGGEALPTVTTSAPTTRARRANRPYHKRFANFKTQALETTKELFRLRPSQLTQEERKVAFKNWVDQMSDLYEMERPTFHWDTEADLGGGGFYRPADHSITMSPNHPSVVTLIHEFRHALQHKQKGAAMVDRDVEIDARAWSLSLYYQCKPRLFERLVREGKIFHITADELD